MSKPSSSKAISHKHGAGCGPGCLIYVFFGMFLLVGGINSFVLFFQPMYKYVSTLSWQEMPCEIVESELERHGDSLTALVEYEYTVKKQDYRCAQVRYHGHPANGKISDDVDEWEKQLTPGSQTVCYVDMSNPRQAVLIRDFSMETLFGLIPLVFLAIGIVGVTIGPRMLKGKQKALQMATEIRRNSEEPGAQAHNDFVARIQSQLGQGSSLSQWVPQGESGPQELKTKGSPLGNFLGTVFFALIWNGVVSIFLFELIDDWRNGDGEWFFTIFLSVFGLIGIVAFFAAIYTGLAMFNPKVQMFVSSPSLVLGETLRAKWVLRGNLNGLRQFTVKLIGEEWCQYRRGTNTYTDTLTFYESVAVSTSDLFEIESGEVEIAIPLETMHSFDAPQNKINWKLMVHGDIKFWPDVKHEFPLVILPSGGAANQPE